METSARPLEYSATQKHYGPTFLEESVGVFSTSVLEVKRFQVRQSSGIGAQRPFPSCGFWDLPRGFKYPNTALGPNHVVNNSLGRSLGSSLHWYLEPWGQQKPRGPREDGLEISASFRDPSMEGGGPKGLVS